MKKYLLIIFICSAGLSAQISGNAKTKLQSLVLPGWGEQSLGESKRAQGFFLRETALWLIFLGGKKAADWYEKTICLLLTWGIMIVSKNITI